MIVRISRCFRCLIGSLLLFPALSGQASDPYASQPLSDVLAEVGRRFGVGISCKGVDPDTVRLRYAAFRLRPYSLDETLDNLLRPVDLVWSRSGTSDGMTRITVRPYEYHRRTPSDGGKLLAWLSGLYDDRTVWEQRRECLRREALEALALDPFLRGLVADPDFRLGREEQHDGYTTQNYALETLPGLYVCGTLYVDMDIFGWGDSERQVGREAHTQCYSMQLQTLWSKAVTDWVLSLRDDIDTTRLAATGGSGGATHTLLLALLDDRFSALAPVVHLVSHFDGGCACESGRPVTLAGGGSCMPELLAAAMAPRPTLIVSDGGDWTSTYPTLEYPFLRRIWGFYGAEEAIRNVHFATERHDYGENKRRAVYAFFAGTLGLDLTRADESRVTLLPESALRSFGDSLPERALRSREELERMLEKLK